MADNFFQTWDYHNPVDVSFGKNFTECIKKNNPYIKVLILTTPVFISLGIISELTGCIEADEISVFEGITPNPSIEEIDRIKQEFYKSDITAIIAVGGGSVVDTAKVLSVILPLDINNPLDFHFRKKNKLDISKSIPVIAIPTTSGTGAECTPFATVWDPANRMKYSLSDRNIYPAKIILDPGLTISLPVDLTLYTGLDAVSHAMESLWNVNANPVSRLYAIQSLVLVNSSFRSVLNDPEGMEGRAKMLQASFFAGMAISQTRTAIAHSLSYPLTYAFGVPHGLACSFSLVSIFEFVSKKNLLPDDVINVLAQTCSMLKSLPIADHLAKFITASEITELIDEMNNGSRMNNFICPVNREDIVLILSKIDYCK